MANKAAFALKFVVETVEAQGLHWETGEALSFLADLGRRIGNVHGSNERLLSVQNNLVVMGNVTYLLQGGLVLTREGRVFRGMMLGSEDLKSVEKLSPVSAFMLTFVTELEQYLKYIPAGEMVPDNFGAEIEKRVSNSLSNTMTSDRYQYMDGGSQHVLVNTYVPAVMEAGFAVKTKNIPGGSALEIGMIPLAKEHHNCAHAFHKGCFISGHIAHINGCDLSEQAKTEITEYMKYLEVSVKLDDESAILISSKEAKGLKRALLALAQVARVENARPAGWMLNGQKHQIRGHVATAAFFPTLEYAPGQAHWVGGEERLPVGLVDHTIRGFEVDGFDVATESSVGSFAFEPVSIAKEGNWFVARFEAGSYVDTTECQVLAVAGQALLEHDGVAGDLEYIRWQVISTLGGKKRLTVEYNIITRERVYKGRSIAKAQVALVDGALVHNELNGGLPQIDVVHTMDGIKSDLVYSWLMPIATTAIYAKDAELLAMISEINSEVEGNAHCEYLRIDPEYVLRGRYEKLQSAFESEYGRVCWFDYQQSLDMAWMMNEMYVRNMPSGWEMVEAPVPAMEYAVKHYNSSDVVAVADGNVEDEKTNVIVFIYKGDEVVGYLRRAYGFVGCYNLEGFEQTTVQQSVTTKSHQMATYVRSLARLSNDPSAWEAEVRDMMREGKGKRMRVKAMHVMNTGIVPAGVKELNLANSEHVAHIKFLLGASGLDYTLRIQQREVFAEMSKVLSAYWLRLSNECVVWLPALCGDEDYLRDSDSSLSLPVLIKQLMLGLLKGDIDMSSEAGQKEYELAAKRVKGMLTALLANPSASKLQLGRKMISAKRIALPSIPCNEVWVLKSRDPNSVYAKVMSNRKIARALRKGQEVLVANNRAPMADGVVTKLRIVTEEENASMFWKLTAYQIFVSPMAIYIDGGDCDGDGHYLTPIKSKVPTFSREDVRRIRSEMLGIDMFNAECDGYARDHYGIKKWGAVQFRPSKKSFQTQHRYVELMSGAAEVQMQMVGAAYTICSLTEASRDVFDGLVKVGVELPVRLSWVTAAGNATVGRGYEFYEVPLGGYSAASYLMWDEFVRPMSNSKKLVQIDASSIGAFTEAIVDMGANRRTDAVQTFRAPARYLAGAFNTSAAIKHFMYQLNLVLGGAARMDSLLSKVAAKYEGCDAELVLFAFAVCYASFESGRGNGVGFKWVDGMTADGGFNLMPYIVSYHKAHKDEEWYKEWLEKSHVMQLFFKHVLKDIASAAVSEYHNHAWLSEEDLAHFGYVAGDEEVVEAEEVTPAGECIEEDYFVGVEFVEDEEGDLFEDEGVAGVFEDESVEVAAVSNIEEVVTSEDENLEVVSVISSNRPATGGVVVGLVSAMAQDGKMVPCNSNLPFNNLTGDFAADVRKSGPNYMQFGFAKDGKVSSYYESPIGFTVAKCQMTQKVGTLSRVQWASAARGFGFDIPKADGVTIVLDTQIAGQSDLSGVQDAADLGEAQFNRDCIRSAMLNGGAEEVSDFVVKSERPVMELLADGQRHYFVVIGLVDRCDSLHKGGSQSRVVCTDMVVLHVKDSDAAFCGGAGWAEWMKSEQLVKYADLLKSAVAVAA